MPCINDVFEMTPQDSVQLIYDQDYNLNDKIKKLSLKRQHTEDSTEKELVDPVFATSYTISIKSNELPVIGTYISPDITPGFYYRVRRIATDNFLWNGQARCLVNIGMGYGKRITFRGDEVLDNTDYYFYSDTEAEGFAFVPAVPEVKRKFHMCDTSNRLIAEVIVTSINRQQVELSSSSQGSQINKRISCCFTCDIHYCSGPGGVRPLDSLTNCGLHGTALVQRSGNSKNSAKIISIDNICINSRDIYKLIPV